MNNANSKLVLPPYGSADTAYIRRLHDRNSEGSPGKGSNGGNNGNDNGNKKDDGGDEGHNCNQDELTGIEWWWWWKWRQACCKTQNGDTRSHMWPVDVAVQVVANEVMDNIEPAVQAIVLDPIRQYIDIQGFIMVLVLSAFLISCIQMMAGLVVVSMGVSLAGVTAIVLALLWRPWKRKGSRSQHEKKTNNGES